MKSLSIVMFLFCSSFLFSQNYKTAIGVKGGYPGYGSLNVKHFIGEKNAIEGSIGGGANSLWLQGLFEINNSLESGFNWYYGGGANIGFYSVKNQITGDRTGNLTLGVSGVVGIEYTFQDFPLNLALDTGPNLSFVPAFGFGWGGAVAVRYAIK